MPTNIVSESRKARSCLNQDFQDYRIFRIVGSVSNRDVSHIVVRGLRASPLLLFERFETALTSSYIVVRGLRASPLLLLDRFSTALPSFRRRASLSEPGLGGSPLL